MHFVYFFSSFLCSRQCTVDCLQIYVQAQAMFYKYSKALFSPVHVFQIQSAGVQSNAFSFSLNRNPIPHFDVK